MVIIKRPSSDKNVKICECPIIDKIPKKPLLIPAFCNNIIHSTDKKKIFSDYIYKIEGNQMHEDSLLILGALQGAFL